MTVACLLSTLGPSMIFTRKFTFTRHLSITSVFTTSNVLAQKIEIN